MIKFNLVKFEKELIFQILEQSIVGTDHISYGICVRHDNIIYTIGSVTCPDISYLIKSRSLYLRGSDEESNFKKTSLLFDTNESRDYYYDVIINILKKAFSNEELFKGKPYYETVENINFYNCI